MGCGILFPRDYRREWDDVDDPAASAVAGGDVVNGASDVDATELGAGDAGFSSSESEDEQWWERPNPDNGTKVQVELPSSAFTHLFSAVAVYVGHVHRGFPKQELHLLDM